MRKILPVAAAIGCGIIILADYMLRIPWLNSVAGKLLEGGMILGAFALLLGVLNLLGHHIARVRDGAPWRWQSWVILTTLPLMGLLGLLFPASASVDWVFAYIISPLQATLGALLVFYAIGAAAATFHLRSGAMILLFVSSLVFLVLWIPFISGLSPLVPVLREWLTAVPLAAGIRGILLGTAIGAIMAALRILLGFDHAYTGPGDEH